MGGRVTVEEYEEWRGLETTREAIQDIKDYILDTLVRVVDLPRDSWVASLDAIRGMHDVLDILEEKGRGKVH
jgi:hypothetical protein